MNSLNSLFGADSPTWLKIALFFLVVVVTLAILWFLVAQIMRTMRRGGFSKRQRQPRLGILEETEVDQRRRLLLVRRDNVEHLLLIGGPTDLVVEQNISRAAPAPSQAVPMPPAREIVEDEDMSRGTYVNAAKAQARASAQPHRIEPLPMPEPAVESFNAITDKMANAFKPQAPIVAPPVVAPPVVSAPRPMPMPQAPLEAPTPVATTAPVPVRVPAPAPVAAPAPVVAPASLAAPAPILMKPPVLQAPPQVASLAPVATPAPVVASAPIIEAPKPILAPTPIAPPAPPKPAPILPNFDSLEDEMAQLLGQKPAPKI